MIIFYRQDDGATLTADGVMLLGHRPSVAVTEHPVEDGATVSDHAIRQPLQIQASVVVTETPYVPTETSQVVGGSQRLQEARQWLDDSVGRLLSVFGSKLGDVTDLLLTSYAHDEGLAGRLIFDLVLKQQQFATVLTVDAPAEKVTTPSAASEDQLGQQARKEYQRGVPEYDQTVSVAQQILGL